MYVRILLGYGHTERKKMLYIEHVTSDGNMFYCTRLNFQKQKKNIR